MHLLGACFLRLPRSCRVEEKSDPISSQEPNYAVFQQTPTVVIAELSALMDPDAINAAACSSIHLLTRFPPFSEILSRCGEIRPDRLPRAKFCCFSAKPDRCDNRSRSSDGIRRCSRASMNFNTFAGCIFLRLPRSYRVAEKSDPIARFSVPDRRKS